ncbi:MAG: molybdopterin-guanine dinucleotide biosynthesis protein B [Phycisphaerae bacterium]|jgi:molybdopterin-guanine dinucleotide biosynthesis protein MobB|nr:molybdopterin-guanine dinucleotide biosynthesis protein B [Phycisphaerae bacterium]MDP7286480.1 molybdopterin-guanine dinucleotide biosynthesis protein B [Phycisphaerae bacterium]
MADHLPILGICGWSGSGKTTLIEKIVPELLASGLKVAILKHDVHGLDVDRPGKDSDRFFNTGADVLAHGPDQTFLRVHRTGVPLADLLGPLTSQYDLLLVEGHKHSDIPKVWLLADDGAAPPVEAGEPLIILSRDDDRPAAVKPLIEEFLADRLAAEPLYGCVLIGGKSTRMGTPKHLIETDGKTWLARTIEYMAQTVSQVVISGAGEVPDELSDYARLPDAPDARGPMSGLLSMMRWSPQASWLVAACDMPDLTGEAFAWLASTRTPGTWATMPKLSDANAKGVEPLLAYYNFRFATLLETQAAADNYRLNDLAGNREVATPSVPEKLTAAWRNANSPQDL